MKVKETTETVDEQLEKDVIDNGENVVENSEAGTEQAEEEVPVKGKSLKAISPDKNDKFTHELLKSYKNYETLYIDHKGGVFSPDTKLDMVGAAILYKNPYYEK